MSTSVLTELIIVRHVLVCLRDQLRRQYHGRVWSGLPDAVDFSRTVALPADPKSLSHSIDHYAEQYAVPAARAFIADVVRDIGRAPAVLFAVHEGEERFDGVCLKRSRSGDSLLLTASCSVARPLWAVTLRNTEATA